MQGQAFSFVRDREPEGVPAAEARWVESLRELARNGYVADPDAPTEGQGILLRHDRAPDLVLLADGRIELPVRPAPRPATGKARPAAAAKKRISWRRTFLVAFVAMIAWTMSVMLGVALISG